jgi:hypothetical protein
MTGLTAPTGPMARPTDPATSHQAPPTFAKLSELQALVLAVHEYSPGGLTNDELAGILTHVKPGTLVKRVTELHRAGKLLDSGRTRPVADSGRDAIVWEVDPDPIGLWCLGCDTPLRVSELAYGNYCRGCVDRKHEHGVDPEACMVCGATTYGGPLCDTHLNEANNYPDPERLARTGRMPTRHQFEEAPL